MYGAVTASILPDVSDDPTRRIPETPPRPLPPEYAAGAPVYAEDEDPRLLADRIRSLQTALALLGVLAVAALGVALWALLTGDDDDQQRVDRRGASTERVAELEARVDELRDAVRDAPSADAVQQLQDDQEQLQAQVDEVAETAGGEQVATDEEARTAVEQLSGQVQELEARIDQVEQAQAEQEATGP